MIVRVESSKDRVLITYETPAHIWFEFLTLKSARDLSLALSTAIANVQAYQQYQKAVSKDKEVL